MPVIIPLNYYNGYKQGFLRIKDWVHEKMRKNSKNLALIIIKIRVFLAGIQVKMSFSASPKNNKINDVK